MNKPYTADEEEEILTTSYFDNFQDWTKQTATYPRVWLIVDRGGDMFIEDADVESGKSFCNLMGSDFSTVEANWLYPLLGLVGEAGELADKFKKVVRDDYGIIQPEKRKAMLLELGDVQYYVARVAMAFGTPLSTVVANLRRKLLDRKKRGVLGGSGDER